ncbi:MAG: DUF2062 domain-containing protein [SAR324 cluster bacterium]|nr:DUF2062 domain-containing protein [SAR324 cluster bacterium]
MKKIIEQFIQEKLINPVLRSTAPVSEVSLGVAVGVFLGLTPTVGVQMYLVAIVWSIYRYIFSRHFNLPVGVALVWISNPLTMVPLYYLFLLTGYWLLETQNGLSYELFREYLSHISSTEGTWEMIVPGARFLLIDLGWPMIIGSLVYAFPGFIISYFMTNKIVTSHRKSMASLAEMSYEDWRIQNETQH